MVFLQLRLILGIDSPVSFFLAVRQLLEEVAYAIYTHLVLVFVLESSKDCGSPASPMLSFGLTHQFAIIATNNTQKRKCHPFHTFNLFIVGGTTPP